MIFYRNLHQHNLSGLFFKVNTFLQVLINQRRIYEISQKILTNEQLDFQGTTSKNPKDIIKYINYHVSKLPTDTSTQLSPNYSITYYEKHDLYQCQISLPSNSHSRGPFIGKLSPNRDQARINAAFLCYKHIENLKKMKNKQKVEFKHAEKIKQQLTASQKYFPEKYPKEFETLNMILDKGKGVDSGSERLGRPGTVKRKQVYAKKVPRCLKTPHADDEEGPGHRRRRQSRRGRR